MFKVISMQYEWQPVFDDNGAIRKPKRIEIKKKRPIEEWQKKLLRKKKEVKQLEKKAKLKQRHLQELIEKHKVQIKKQLDRILKAVNQLKAKISSGSYSSSNIDLLSKYIEEIMKLV